MAPPRTLDDDPGRRMVLEQTLSDLGAAGATLAVLLDGNEHFRAGLGELRPRPDAGFYAYSVTKTVLATLAVQLAAEGRLDLEDPIRTWLPDLALRHPITVRQLLNHTAGLPDYGGLAAYHEALASHPETAWPPSRYQDLIADETLLFAPGQGWSYSNLGYMLVNRLIAVVSRQDTAQDLASRITGPLGLTATRFVSSRAEASDLTPGYGSLGGGPRANLIARYDPGWVAHGVVRSTALELARLLEGLMTARLVEKPWLEQMLAAVPVPGAFPPGRDPGYGLGLMAQTLPFGRVMGHNGGGPGYSVACWSLARAGRRLVGACMVNEDLPNAAQTLLFKAFEALLG